MLIIQGWTGKGRVEVQGLGTKAQVLSVCCYNLDFSKLGSIRLCVRISVPVDVRVKHTHPSKVMQEN